MDVWEVRKQILYGDDACPSHLQSQSSVGDLGGVTGVDGHRSGKLDKRGKSVHVNTCSIHFGTNSCVRACVCCSAHGSGCVVDGGLSNNNNNTAIASPPSATHPQLWAELHIHVQNQC